MNGRREAGTPAKKAAKKPAKKAPAPKTVATKKPAGKSASKVAAKKPATTKKAAKTTPAKKAAAPKATAPAAPTSATPVSKSAFIRSQPTSMPARDVVEAARAAGITMTTKFVYNVRGGAKATEPTKKPSAVKPVAAPTKKPSAPKAAPKPKAAPVKAAPTGGSDQVVAFRRLVLGLGITRSRQLLDELERGLARLIGGRARPMGAAGSPPPVQSSGA